MTTENSQPLTRREMRARERSQERWTVADPTREAGAPAHRADISTSPNSPAAPAPAAWSSGAIASAATPTPSQPMTRREARARYATEQGSNNSSAVFGTSSTGALPRLTAESVRGEPNSSPEPIVPTQSGFRTDELRAGTIVSRPNQPDRPMVTSITTGPIHWADALTLTSALSPTEPTHASIGPAVINDTSTIIVDHIPGVNTPTTGTVDLLVTGTIRLPTALSETGALPDTLDTAEVVANIDVVDEPRITGMQPIAATLAVSSRSTGVELVQAPRRERVSPGLVVAWSIGGMAGLILVALGVAALLGRI